MKWIMNELSQTNLFMYDYNLIQLEHKLFQE